MSKNAQVPSFLPSMSGLHFANGLNLGSGAGQIGSIPITLPIIGTVPITAFNNGQCGGYSWAVCDFFQAEPRLLMLAEPVSPAEPALFTPLFDYIIQRQIDSVVGLADGIFPYNAYRYALFLIIPLHDTVFSGSLAPHGVSYYMLTEDVPSIMNDIDRGALSPLSLVASTMTSGHQVVAYKYFLDDADNLTLWVYDSNEPSVDTATISLNINDPGYHTLTINWGLVGANLSSSTVLRGFFRESFNTADLGASLIALAGQIPATLGQLQPLAPAWNAWQSFGFAPDDLCLQSPYATYVEGQQALDPLGFAPGTSPAVCSWGTDRLDVFIQDNEGMADHFSWSSGVEGWEMLGASLLSYPAAASWAEGRLDLFGVIGDLNFSMGHVSYDNGSWQANWESLGFADGNWRGIPVPLDGSVSSAEQLEGMTGAQWLSRPAACSWSAGHLDLFASYGRRREGDAGHITDTDAGIAWATFDNGSWTPWLIIDRTFGMLPGSAPAACSWASGRIDLFAISGDLDLATRTESPGSLMHRSYDAATGGWSASWDNLGAPPGGFGSPFIQSFTGPGGPSSEPNPPSPAASTWGVNRLDVFAIGADSQLWHLVYDGQWQPWQNIGGMIQADPACASWSEGRIDVFAPASDFALWHVWFQD